MFQPQRVSIWTRLMGEREHLASRCLVLALLCLLLACAPVVQPQEDSGGPLATPAAAPSPKEEIASSETSPDPSDGGAPARVLVRVLDERGSPIPDARVVVAGRGERADLNGDVRVLRVPPGALVLEAQAEGYAFATQGLEASEGGQHRLTLRLAPTKLEVLASDGAVSVSHARFLLTGAAGALARMDGAAPSPGAYLTWARPSGQSGPSTAFAQRRDGQTGAISPLAVLQLTAADVDGSALHVRSDAHLTWTEIVPEPELDSATDELSLWWLDAASATWVEQPASLIQRVRSHPQETFVARLPQTGTWALARAERAGCLSVRVDTCAGLEELPLEVALSSANLDERRAVSALDPAPWWEHLPSGPAEIALLANGQVLDRERVEIPAGARCAELSLEPPRCEGVAIATRTRGACPSAPARVRLRSPELAVERTLSVEGIRALPTLPAGPWVAELLGPRGETLDREAVTVSPGSLAGVILEGAPDAGEPPPGGCMLPPCHGWSCDACVLLSGQDALGELVSDATVSVWGPMEGEHSTDGSGELCLNVPDGVGQEVQASIEGGQIVAVPLRASGSCATPARCAYRVLSSSALPPVPEGWYLADSVPRLLSWAEPGWLEELPAAPLREQPGSSLRLSLEGAARSLAAGGTLGCEDNVTAAIELVEDAVGMLRPGDMTLRCSAGAAGELTVRLRWVNEPEGPTQLSVPEDLGVTLTLGPPGGAAVETWEAHGGSATLISRGGGRLDLRLSLEINSDGGLETGLAKGWLSAPLLSAADTPRTVAGLAARTLTGHFTSVRDLSTGERHMFGPSGSLLIRTAGPGDGPIKGASYSLPSTSVAWTLGELAADDMPSSSILLLPLITRPDAPDADVVSRADADPDLWMARDLAETLAARSGAPAWSLDTGGLVFGRAQRWDEALGALVPTTGFGEVRLERTDGAALLGTPLDQALRPVPAAEASLYVFVGVPPSTEDAPYTLRLIDASGAEVEGHRRTLVGAAGRVTLVGWEVE